MCVVCTDQTRGGEGGERAGTCFSSLTQGRPVVCSARTACAHSLLPSSNKTSAVGCCKSTRGSALAYEFIVHLMCVSEELLFTVENGLWDCTKHTIYTHTHTHIHLSTQQVTLALTFSLAHKSPSQEQVQVKKIGRLIRTD